MLRRFRERRRLRRLVLTEAARVRPLLAELRADADQKSSDIRASGADLPGFPPACPRCGRGMVAERERLPKKRYRWVWRCRGGCWQTLAYSKLTIDEGVFDA